MRKVVYLAICAAVLAVGCGKSPAEKQADQMKDAVDQMAKGAEQMGKQSNDMAQGAAAFAKGLAGMANGLAGGDPNQKPVDPVSFRDLEAAFGDMSGWEKGKPTGERMTNPVNYSEAKVTYTKGESRIEAQISDSAFNQLLIAPIAMFLSAGYEKENDHSYEKGTKIGENPALEKFDSEEKSGELTILVNKRFIVQLDGRHLSDVKALHDAVNAVDIKKLQSIK